MADSFAGGFSRTTIWGIASGYAIGQNTSMPANDTTNNAFSINKGAEATANFPALTRVDFLGADAVQGRMSFGDNGAESLQITLDSINTTLLAFLGGTAVDTTTNTSWEFFTSYTNAATVPNVGAMVTQRFQNPSTGATQYLNDVYMLTQCLATLGSFGYQAKRSVTLDFTPSKATKDPGGQLLSAYNMSIPDGEAPVMQIISDNPLAMTTYVADGIETDFTTQYKPTSAVVTVNASPNYMWLNGVLTAPTSFATATGLVTIAAAGSAADVIVMLYETAFVAT